MPIPEKDKLNRLEELKSKLFSNNFQTKIEYRDNYTPRHVIDLPDSWEKENTTSTSEPTKPPMKTSIFKKFFFFSIIFFVLALGYVAYTFFAGGNTVSNDNIDVSVLGSAFTRGGEDLPLQIEIVNRNSSALDLVDLVVEYPNGGGSTASSGSAGDTERIRTSLGTIPSGATRDENIKIVLFGEQGSVHDVKISLEYRLEGSNAIFVKDKVYQVTINSTPINLSVDAPTEVNPNEEMSLNVKATLNSIKTASNMMIKVDYPVGFQFEKSTPSPTVGNNVWNLGDLSPGSESNIKIEGKMVDVFDGEEKTFQVYSGTQSKSDKAVIGVVFNSLGHTVSITKPFISAKLSINGVYEREFAVNSKTYIGGDINWINNLDTNLSDMEIHAKITGNAFDRNTIKAQKGFYDSATDTITWNKDYDSNFSNVAPGDSGTASFSLSPLSLYSAESGMLSQPTINIDVTITGKQSANDSNMKLLTNKESKIIRIISDVGFGAKALYYSGPFVNKGPIPPKVAQETTYTVVWSLSNTSNNISKTQIKSTLPPWIKFVGTVKPSGEDLNYNASTREIVWNAGGIPKGTGITGSGREVAFQVSFTPSLSQVDDIPAIINDAILTGHDDFANVDVKVNKSALTTRLSNDAQFISSGSKVVK